MVKKDIKNNIVYVSKNLNDGHIWTNELKLRDVIVRDGVKDIISPSSTNDILVRLRHRAPLIPAKIILEKSGEATLKFANKIKRPAAGQSAVIYDDKICLGGGIIG